MKNKFTMVECLIVVSIIVILMSLLLPTLNSALARVKGIACSANLKQLGIAANLYITDNNDAGPCYNGNLGNYSGKWQDMLMRYTHPSQPIKDLGYLNPANHEGFREPKKPFLCPAVTPLQYDITKVVRHYAINYNLSGSFSAPNNQRLSRVKRPSQVHYISDAAFNGTAGAVGRKENMAFLHTGLCNILFLDSHVSGMKLNAVTPYTTNYFWRGE